MAKTKVEDDLNTKPTLTVTIESEYIVKTSISGIVSNEDIFKMIDAALNFANHKLGAYDCMSDDSFKYICQRKIDSEKNKIRLLEIYMNNIGGK